MRMTRREAAIFIDNQLAATDVSSKGGCWHYGKVELRKLLDAIYGPPDGPHEELPPAGCAPDDLSPTGI